MKFPENMAQVADLGVDFLGFIFYPKSPRYMCNTLTKADLDSLPASIQKAGVFVNESLETILQHTTNFNLDIIQLHGNESPEMCQELRKNKLTVFKAFSVDENFDPSSISSYENAVDYLLLDTKTKGHGGSGRKFDWSILDKIKSEKPIILSGGIGPDDAKVINTLAHPNIVALDLNSRFEDEPGLKNTNSLQLFFNELENL